MDDVVLVVPLFLTCFACRVKLLQRSARKAYSILSRPYKFRTYFRVVNVDCVLGRVARFVCENRHASCLFLMFQSLQDVVAPLAGFDCMIASLGVELAIGDMTFAFSPSPLISSRVPIPVGTHSAGERKDAVEIEKVEAERKVENQARLTLVSSRQ